MRNRCKAVKSSTEDVLGWKMKKYFDFVTNPSFPVDFKCRFILTDLLLAGVLLYAMVGVEYWVYITLTWEPAVQMNLKGLLRQICTRR
jgi:hypothetical protein